MTAFYHNRYVTGAAMLAMQSVGPAKPKRFSVRRRREAVAERARRLGTKSRD